MSTYKITFVNKSWEQPEVIEVQDHYFDPNIPGVMVIQDAKDNFIYIPLENYDQIIIDGKGLEKVKAEADAAKATEKKPLIVVK